MKNWISNIDFVGLALSFGCAIGFCTILIVALMLIGFVTMLCPYVLVVGFFVYIWYIVYKIITEL